MRITGRLFCIWPAVGVVLAAHTRTQATDFTRVVDSTTAVPDGAGPFAQFGAPAYDGVSIAFLGGGSGSQGIYTNAGGPLRRVADRTTIIPNFTVNFAFFGAPSLENGR